MIITRKIPTDILLNLRDALSSIYWYKNELRDFILLTISNKSVVYRIDWENNSLSKYKIVSQIIMNLSEPIYYNDIINLINAVCSFSDFTKLKNSPCSNPEDKIKKAKEIIIFLKKNSKKYKL